MFMGINNCSTVLPYVATERTVLYREKFAGMYAPWAYSFAQVQHDYHHVEVLFCFHSISWCFMDKNKSSPSDVVGDYRSTLCIIASSFVCDYHISINWVLLVSFQGLLVLLHNILHISILCLSRDAASCNDPKCWSSFHIGQCSLPYIESFLRLPAARTRKSFILFLNSPIYRGFSFLLHFIEKQVLNLYAWCVHTEFTNDTVELSINTFLLF